MERGKRTCVQKTLTKEDDCFGVGDGCLIDRYEIDRFHNRKVPGIDIENWLEKYVGKKVTIVDFDKVYCGKLFLGIYYS